MLKKPQKMGTGQERLSIVDITQAYSFRHRLVNRKFKTEQTQLSLLGTRSNSLVTQSFKKREENFNRKLFKLKMNFPFAEKNIKPKDLLCGFSVT